MDNQAQRDREKLTQASAKISQENRKMLEHIDELMRRGQMLEARIVSSNHYGDYYWVYPKCIVSGCSYLDQLTFTV